MISVTSESESQIMKINVAASDKKETAQIVNTLSDIAQKEVKCVMGIDNLLVSQK